MRCLREPPVLWQWGQGITGCPQFVCMYWSDDQHHMKPNLDSFSRPRVQREAWRCDSTAQEIITWSETTSRHCLHEQRAVCHYKHSFVQSVANNSQRLIISAVISAWQTGSEVLSLNCSHFLKQTTIIHSDGINLNISSSYSTIKTTRACCYDLVRHSDITASGKTKEVLRFIRFNPFWSSEHAIILKHIKLLDIKLVFVSPPYHFVFVRCSLACFCPLSPL